MSTAAVSGTYIDHQGSTGEDQDEEADSAVVMCLQHRIEVRKG